MANDLARAQFWKEFILRHSGYPARERLKAHLSGAQFSEFCDCGCNSFAVTVMPNVPNLVPADNPYGAIFEADFMLGEQRTLEIILFANEAGNLSYVEIDCCANSYPVPDLIEVGEPFHTSANASILH